MAEFPSFLRLSNIPPICFFFIHFSWSFTCWQAFRLLLCVGYCSKVAVNMGVHISHWNPDFSSFGYIPQSEIAKSYDNLNLNFLRKLMLSSRGCTVLHFTRTNSVEGFQLLCIFTNTLKKLAVLTDVSDVSLWFWFAFPCWLMMFSLFSCTTGMLTSCTSSLEKCQFKLFFHF